jgi:hypothetical protein
VSIKQKKKETKEGDVQFLQQPLGQQRLQPTRSLSSLYAESALKESNHRRPYLRKQQVRREDSGSDGFTSDFEGRFAERGDGAVGVEKSKM